jgi:hypothetical protein
MTHPTILTKKARMCRRFGHVRRVTFRTMRGVLAYYCARCGECCAANTEGK